MQKLTQFLDINGKLVWFLNKNGAYYIAIKPICEAFGVDYIRQFKNLKDDSILAPELSKQTMQVPGDQNRTFMCLPEKYIYGYIFTIKSESPILCEYKKKVHDILYNHFHGSLTAIKQTLEEKDTTHALIESIEKELRESDPKFKELEALYAKEMRMGKAIKEQLRDLQHGQLSLNLK